MSTPKPRSRGYGASVPRRRCSASHEVPPSKEGIDIASNHQPYRGVPVAPRKLRGFQPMRGARVQALWSEDTEAGYFNGTVVSGPAWSSRGDTYGVLFDDGDQDDRVLLRWVRHEQGADPLVLPPCPHTHAQPRTPPASSPLPYAMPPCRPVNRTSAMRPLVELIGLNHTPSPKPSSSRMASAKGQTVAQPPCGSARQ